MLRILMMAAVLARVDAAPPPEEAGTAEAADEAAAASTRPSDPNYSRLMFAPTGRPLRKGDGYFSDHELVFPGFAYGLSDNVSVSGGVSTLPGLGLSEQLVYFSPKVGFELSDRAAVSLGGLVAGAGGADDIGTLGSPSASGPSARGTTACRSAWAWRASWATVSPAPFRS